MVSLEGNNLETSDQVADYMDQNMVETMFRGEVQRFLPKLHFDIATSENVIRCLVMKDKEVYSGQKAAEVFIRRIVLSGRRIFATCVFSGMPLSCVKALFEDGLSDERPPLKSSDCPGLAEKREFRNTFIPNQKLFNPAFLSLDSEQTWNNHVSKPIEFNEDSKSLLGSGTFGNVYQIQIDPNQHSLPLGPNKDSTFAMKVTQHEGTREVSFHRAMASIPPHPHLLRCLASFTFSSKYHMIYEKADSDVETFMKNNPTARGLSDMNSTDFAQQLYGLACALAAIHNHSPSSSPQKAGLLSVPAPQPQRAGYIHDIKPENLLVFTYPTRTGSKKKYWFRLSDFSCAKVNDFEASVSGNNRASYKTSSKSGTPVYRAPESVGKDKKTSRPYDLWSLGCVYLELLVWYLEGYESLCTFRTAREQSISPDGREDEGFYFKEKESDDFRLRDVVLRKIDMVQIACKGPLKAIADAIPRLLKIDPHRRPTAEALVKELAHIGRSELGSFNAGDSRLGVDAPRLRSRVVPVYESDSDSSVDLPGGPSVMVHFSTED